MRMLKFALRAQSVVQPIFGSMAGKFFVAESVSKLGDVSLAVISSMKEQYRLRIGDMNDRRAEERIRI